MQNPVASAKSRLDSGPQRASKATSEGDEDTSSADNKDLKRN